jgi:hypothetical protein
MSSSGDNILARKNSSAAHSKAAKSVAIHDMSAKAATAAPAPTSAEPALTAQCTIERSKTAAGPENVGEHMTLTCLSDFGAALGDNAQVKAADGQDYSLYILKVLNSTPQSFTASATSYRATPHDGETYVITDGKVTFKTSPLSFKIESVVVPKEGQEPKPYPSYGPFVMSYPLWMWLSIGAAVLLVAFGIFWSIWRRQKRKKLLAELEKFTTMLPAFGQFSKDARMSVKKLGAIRSEGEAAELVKKIDEDFRLYLIRELKVPALQTSNREILREIKRSHPLVFVEYQGDLRRILFELERANRDSKIVQPKDCEELLFLSRKVADNIYAVKRRSK